MSMYVWLIYIVSNVCAFTIDNLLGFIMYYGLAVLFLWMIHIGLLVAKNIYSLK